MANGRRTGGAPWWLRIYAIAFAAALLLTLTITYLTTVHVWTAAARFASDAGVPRPIRAVPYADLINRTAAAERLNPALLAAVIAAESGFDPRARSPRGAWGLMQVMPVTWREVGGTAACRAPVPPCVDDPEANVAVGAAYLRRLVDRFGGNMVLAVAAYNAGAAPVRRYGGVPPFPETTRYMRQVTLAWFHLQYAGTLSPLWFKVIRSFDLWQQARSVLIGAIVLMAVPWVLALRRPESGGVVPTGVS